MALVKGPLFSADARGSVGPLTFSRNSYGQICRGRICPVNPLSFSQTEFRQEVWGNVMFNWCNLSLANQNKWQEFSQDFYSRNSLGQQTRLNPRDWFFKFNLPLQRHYSISLTNPPLNPCPSYLPDMSISWESSYGTLTFSPSIPSNGGISIWQARNQPDGRLHYRDYLYWGSILYDDTSPQTITSEVGNAFTTDSLPAILPGLIVSFLFRSFDSYGRMSCQYKIDSTSIEE